MPLAKKIVATSQKKVFWLYWQSAMLLALMAISMGAGAELGDVVFLSKDQQRPCNNKVTFFIDDKEQWQMSLDNLR